MYSPLIPLVMASAELAAALVVPLTFLGLGLAVLAIQIVFAVARFVLEVAALLVLHIVIKPALRCVSFAEALLKR